jgi:hypothetical protein
VRRRIKVISIFFVLIGALFLLMKAFSFDMLENTDPFYMGERDELFIDYCKVCGKRHNLKCEKEKEQ